jgi:Zn-dependent protease with chaperone function
MADTDRPERSPQQRAWATVVAFAGPPAIVLGVVGLLVAGYVVGLVVLVVVAGARAGWARRAGPGRVRAGLGAAPADPVRHARLINLVDGLASSSGLRMPDLLVVPTPGLNALAAGMTPDTSFVAVTQGLLDELSRVELEAVLAEELVQIRQGDAVPATVRAATFGWGARFARSAGGDARADQLAVSLTRYPPGLEAALQKVEGRGATVPGVPRSQAHLWLADPLAAGPAGDVDVAVNAGRLPLRERVEALREL